MFKSFGSTKEVFVNQDEGMFIAFPITLDSTVLTLETESRNSRTYVKAGSVVIEGSTVRGILAEEYDITDGPVSARVVLEGYAWASRLTSSALANIASLPKIVVMPYNYVSFALVSEDTTAHKATIKILNGAKFKSTIDEDDLTVTTLTADSVALNDDKDELTITFAAAGSGSIDAVATTALDGNTEKIYGLPIEVTV